MKQNMIMMLFLSCFFTLVQSGDDARQAEHEKRTHETDSDFFKNLGEEGEMKYRAGMTRYAVNPDPEPWSNRAKLLESELKEKRALVAKKIQKAWKESKKPKLTDEEQDRLNQELMNAALNPFSDTSKIIALVQRGANPNVKTQFLGTTPLHSVRTEDLTKVLLAAGADVKAKDNDGRTPLHLAQTEEQTRALLAAGADVKAKDNDGITPLHLAQTEGQTRALLAAGADVKAKDNDGRTPLHWARKEGKIKTLIAAGADPNVKNNKGDTPLESEFKRGWVASTEIMDNLIKGGSRVSEYLKTNPFIKQAAREAMEEKIQALKTRDALRSKSFDFDAANLVNEYVGK